MGLVDKIKQMTGTNETYQDEYDDNYYNEFDDSYDNQAEDGMNGAAGQSPAMAQSGAGMSMGSGGISLSGSSVELKVIKPKEFSSANQIADHLLNKRTVVLNLENADKETARRLIDFLGGVAYSIGGNLKAVSTNAYVITPDNVDVGVDRLGGERRKTQQQNDEDAVSDF